MRKEYLIIVAILFISAIIFAVFFQAGKPVKPSPNESIECQSLIYNGEGRISIVFFSDKENAEKYSKFFLESEPFDENKDRFNFYYINSQPECEIYNSIALLCYSKELIKKAASCPNDYIIVLNKQPSSIRSSAYMNVMSLNLNHPLNVLLHEFGHVFANLAEEYVPAEIPSNSKNCVDNCDKFNIKDGCFKGCSKASFSRSIKEGVMRTLTSKNYGLFNKKLITERIFSQSRITGNAISPLDCSSENFYLIEGIYNQQQIEIISRDIGKGCSSFAGSGGFAYSLVVSGNSAPAGEFNPELIYTDAPSERKIEIDGETFISDQPFFLTIPKLEDLDMIEITKDKNKLSEIRLNDIGAKPCKK